MFVSLAPAPRGVGFIDVSAIWSDVTGALSRGVQEIIDYNRPEVWAGAAADTYGVITYGDPGTPGTPPAPSAPQTRGELEGGWSPELQRQRDVESWDRWVEAEAERIKALERTGEWSPESRLPGGATATSAGEFLKSYGPIIAAGGAAALLLVLVKR